MVRAEGLLFDMDGTLIDSTEVAVRCWLRWGAEYGFTVEQLLEVHVHGRPSEAIVAALLPPDQVPAGVARIEELEVSETEGLVTLPGTVELLASLPPERWAVVTSASRVLARARLAASGIGVSRLVTADDIARGKPDPEPFVAGARLLGVPVSRCVVFEDAPAGVEAARAAGAAVVAVTTTTEAAALHADAVVADLSRVRVRVDGDGGLDVRTLGVEGV